MQVPLDLKNNKYIETNNKNIFITRFEQNAPSKIFTEVRENLLVLVLKGQKKLVYKDYETVVHEGEFAFFCKGNYIMNQIVNQSEYQSLLIFVSNEFMRKIRKKSISKGTAERELFYKGNIVEHMQDEIELLMHLIEKNEDAYDEILNHKIQELFLYIQMEDKTGQFNDFLNTFTEDESFVNYLANHYDRTDDIKTMAKDMNLSLSTFKRKFAEVFQCTPHKWIIERKLEKAISLMETTDYLVTDICFISGFESMTTFISLFKKKYGASPGKYRKNLLC